MPPCRLATTLQPSMHTHADIYCTHPVSGIESLGHIGLGGGGGGQHHSHIDSGVEISAKDLNHSRLLAPPILTASCGAAPPVAIRVKNSALVASLTLPLTGTLDQ